MKPQRFELAVLALFFTINVYVLFAPPSLGIANNGDFWRVMYPVGVEYTTSVTSDQAFNYFNTKYRIVPIPEKDNGWRSSAVLFAWPARWINLSFGDRQTFDLRVMGALYLLVYLFGVYLIIVSSRGLKLTLRCALALVLLFWLTDPGYTAYFNSFYSEPVALVCMTIVIGSSLVLITGQSGAKTIVIGYFIASALLIMSKPMYAPFAFLLGPFGIYLWGITRVRYRFWAGAVAALALVGVLFWHQSEGTRFLRLYAGYIGVFGTVLMGSTTPAEDLQDMGLNPEWARYAGTQPWPANSPIKSDPEFVAEFQERFSMLTLPRFFVKHPKRFWRIASNAVPSLLDPRPGYAGYYEKSSGKPALSKPLAPWSSMRARIVPGSLWFILLYFASGLLSFAVSLRKGSPRTTRGLLLLHSLLVSLGAVVVFLSLLTMGTIDPRFAVTFLLGLDTAIILGVVGLAKLVRTQRSTAQLVVSTSSPPSRFWTRP